MWLSGDISELSRSWDVISNKSATGGMSVFKKIPETGLHKCCKPILYKESGDCWISHRHYDGSRGSQKVYFTIVRNGEQEYLHRHVYKLYNGEIPEGMVVRHLCHNTHCINPRHLAVGDQHDNMMDSVNDGRFPSGSSSWNAKLTKEQFKTIMESLLHRKDNHTATIAREVGLSEWIIKRIREGVHWSCKEWGKGYSYPIACKIQQKPVTEAVERLVLLDLKAGDSNRAIRQRYGISKESVLKIKKKHGLVDEKWTKKR
jgi:hypothetical protein